MIRALWSAGAVGFALSSVAGLADSERYGALMVFSIVCALLAIAWRDE